MSAAGLATSRVLAAEYSQVARSLRPEEWPASSRCPGWSVKDLVAHLSSNFRVLVEPPPPAEPVPGLTAEQAQDLLVVERRPWTAEQVLAELEQYRQPALDVLAAMQEEPLASQSLTLYDLGTYPMSALADAFAFDLYCHLRVDMLAPTGPVRRQLPKADDERLAPGIGWMLTGLPQMCPAVTAVLDRPIGLRLTGPGGGDYTLGSAPDRPVVTEGITDVAAVATSPAHEFVLWGTKRTDWRAGTTIEGDRDYAATVLDAINIV
ncbi:MAG: maleylpyruvate isomerase family mycothiol-dependent enzyme [Actinobacteria bacterium]|nr:maleylpyruvate isomerase family mycothiol-dependent enzyme [Actinomycetota bacterium]